MFVVDENSGDLTLHQGDTGEYVVTGLPDNREGARIYFEVQDAKRKTVGSQIPSVIERQTAVFRFNQSLTNLLTVRLVEETAEYYGGIKICTDEGDEETVNVGDKQDGERIIITVYPKVAEGD